MVLNYWYDPTVYNTEETTQNWLKIIPDKIIVQYNELKLLDSFLGEGNYFLDQSLMV